MQANVTIFIIHDDDHHHHHQDVYQVLPPDWKGEGYVCRKHKKDTSDGTRGVELEPENFYKTSVPSGYIQIP